MIPLLLLGDTLALILSLLCAYSLRNYGIFRDFLSEIQPLSVYVGALPVALVLYLFSLLYHGLYSRDTRLHAVSEITQLFRAHVFWLLSVMSAAYLIKYDYSRVVMLLTGFSLILCGVLLRLLVRDMQLRLVRQGYFDWPVLIIGTGSVAREVRYRLKAYRGTGLRVCGMVPAALVNPDIVSSVRAVYIADESLSYEEVLSLVMRLSASPLRCYVVADVFSRVVGLIDPSRLDSIPSLDVTRLHRSVWAVGIKRVCDVVGSVCGLVLLFPLIVIISFLIAWGSPGNIFFSQVRVGKGGSRFVLYKFRTMYAETPAYADPPEGRFDPRITPIGRFLRRTSLDELPQLWNVLKGDMSLVGPRPEMPYKVAEYREWQKLRLLVKPGLTGLWQVVGRKDLNLHDHLEYDVYYLHNQSFWFDCEILLRTIPVVLKGTGAY